MAAALEALRATDHPSNLGALKLFEIPEGEERKKAHARLVLEARALEGCAEAGLLRLIKANPDKHFIVTEYHPHGTLASLLERTPGRYKGDLRATIEALRPIVAGVAALHPRGVIHRDIKPENIFVADEGRLVLGDFGIVIFQDAAGERLTETFDRPKGTRDWMAPWAYTGKRITLEDIDGSFDVFPLGKVLWVMLSGDRMLPLWYYARPEYNLEQRFPANPDMRLANAILARCVVEEKLDCLPSAAELLTLIDKTLEVLRQGGELLRRDQPRPCRVCGLGTYRPEDQLAVVNLSGRPLEAMTFVCDACGHLQMFRAPKSHLGPGWQPRS